MIYRTAFSRAAVFDFPAYRDVTRGRIDRAADNVLDRRTGPYRQVAGALYHRSGRFNGVAFKRKVRYCQFAVNVKQRYSRKISFSGYNSHTADAFRGSQSKIEIVRDISDIR